MEFKDIFNGYEVQPDPKVWESLNQTLHKKLIMRRSAIFGIPAVVVVTSLFFFLPSLRNTSELQMASLPVDVVEEIISLEYSDVSDNATSEDAVQAEVAEEPIVEATPEAEVPVSSSKATTPAYSQMQALPVDQKPKVSSAETKKVAQQAPVQQITTPRASAEKTTATTTKATTTQKQNSARNPENETWRTENASKPHTAKLLSQSKAPQAVTPTGSLQVHIPNAFAPDDPNDAVRTFKVVPSNPSNVSKFKLYIYNRAGRQVYYSSDYTRGWDGTANGQAQPKGSYVYILEYYDAEHGLQHTRGALTLIR